MAYFSGQGRVYIGARDEFGNPAGLTFVGNVPELKVSLSVDTIEHQEAQAQRRSGKRQHAGQLPATQDADGGHGCRGSGRSSTSWVWRWRKSASAAPTAG